MATKLGLRALGVAGPTRAGPLTLAGGATQHHLVNIQYRNLFSLQQRLQQVMGEFFYGHVANGQKGEVSI